MHQRKGFVLLFCLLLSLLFVATLTGCGGGGGGGAAPAAVAVCSNNVIEGSEVCDGTALAGKTCLTQGFDSGTLACKSDCSGFNTTSCVRATSCGDGVKNGNEQCDSGGSNTNTACAPAYGGSCTYCDTSCLSHTITGGSCGDNTVNGTETCDQGAANTNTACVAAYGSSCSYCDTSCVSHTVAGASCGDGTINGTEACDNGASNTNNACVPGASACTYCDTSCVSHTVNLPPVTCGNSIINTGETCDNGGANTNTACAPAYGSSCNYCDTSCQTHSVVGPYCGDNSVNGTEQCDTGLSNTNTACTPAYGSSCNYCDTTCHSHVVAGAYCGDGTTNGSEQCDNGSSNTNTACTSGYGGNCNYCDLVCHTHTVTGPYCGDGIINGSEQCDGSALGGATCVSLGFDSGSLSCSSCLYNSSDCTTSFPLQHYVDKWAAGGNPRGMDVNGNRLYVADSTHNQVTVFNRTTHAVITTLNYTDISPDSVCVSTDGSRIIIGGGTGSNFEYVTFNGSTYSDGGSFGSQGPAVGQFHVIEQCVFDTDGINVRIVDDSTSPSNITNHRIQTWNTNTHSFSLFGLGGKGSSTTQYNRPWGIAHDTQNNYYVCDAGNTRIKKLDSSGNYISLVSSNVAGCSSLAMDSANHLYAANSTSHVIRVYYDSGSGMTYKGDLSNGGTSDGNFVSIVGIAITLDGIVYGGEQTTDEIKELTY